MANTVAFDVKRKRYENYNDWDGVTPVFIKNWLVCRECGREFESKNHPRYAFNAAADHAAKEHGYIRETIKYEIVQGEGCLTGEKEEHQDAL